MFDHLFAQLPAHLREQRDPRAVRVAAGRSFELAKITMIEAIALAHGWEMQHDESVV